MVTRLYPGVWRRRYGPEFEIFLMDGRFGIDDVFNIVLGAIRQHFQHPEQNPMRETHDMSGFRWSIVLTAYAWFAALAAGINFQATVDDTPLVPGLQPHNWLSFSWTIVKIGSVLALAGVLATAIPVSLSVLRYAYTNRRRDIFKRLAVPPLAGALVIVWVAATALWNGHWAALPWAITGDWAVPAGWPSLATRWFLGSVTTVLIVLGALVSAVSIRETLQLADIPERRLSVLRFPMAVVTAAMVVMSAGIAAWGIAAHMREPVVFQSHQGIFGSTMSMSWGVSLILFSCASIMSIVAARSAARSV
jgi:hypothetical protein